MYGEGSKLLKDWKKKVENPYEPKNNVTFKKVFGQHQMCFSVLFKCFAARFGLLFSFFLFLTYANIHFPSPH
jgi:hypothetical protein